MKSVFFMLSFFLIVMTVKAQNGEKTEEGEVTFITSENVYVHFASTENIRIGDTLLRNVGGRLKPCLVVTQKSSTSCVSYPLPSCSPKKGDKVVHRYTVSETASAARENEAAADSTKSKAGQSSTGNKEQESEEARQTVEEKPYFTERIRGRVSLASYSNISSSNNDGHRAMARFYLSARHIGNSRWSVESYAAYLQNFVQGERPQGYRTSFMRVYNMAVRYDADSSFSVLLGRRINRRMSSLGAIDGLQAEKHFGRFYAGAVAGFRPDISNYGFNSKLFQYGAYLGLGSSGRSSRNETTIGVLEQRNGSQIDRRYAYLQHSATLMKDLHLFSSAELDFYRNVNGVASSTPRLTNFYLSMRYKINRKWSANISYDARKRVIYYESIKTEVERLLDNDISRNGLRLGLRYRPNRKISTGLSYSKRFQADRLNRSDNVNAYLRFSDLGGIGGSLFIAYNFNQSIYLQSNIASIRFTHSIVENKVNASFYYRYVNFKYLSFERSNPGQHYFGVQSNTKLTGSLSLGLLGELSLRNGQNNVRVNTSLIKRF